MLDFFEDKCSIQLSNVFQLGQFVPYKVVVIFQAFDIDFQYEINLAGHMVALLYFVEFLDLTFKVFDICFVMVLHGNLTKTCHRFSDFCPY